MSAIHNVIRRSKVGLPYVLAVAVIALLCVVVSQHRAYDRLAATLSRVQKERTQWLNGELRVIYGDDSPITGQHTLPRYGRRTPA